MAGLTACSVSTADAHRLPTLPTLTSDDVCISCMSIILLVVHTAVDFYVILISAEPHFLCNYATPKREDLERLVVTTIAGNWKPVALHLGVKQSLIDIVTRNNPKDCEEACRSVLDRWLKGDRNSGRKERTWRTVVEALEERSFGTQADQLIREMVDTGTHG